MKLNGKKLLRLLSRVTKSKKHNPAYLNVIKELEKKDYKEAILRCQEYLPWNVF